MTRTDKIAIFLSLLAVLVTAWVAFNIFEGLPHLEDEFAYRWQARVIARGELTTPSPPNAADSFLVPFVVDHQGQRFSKYPLGWPVVLAAGEKVSLPWLVNPLLAGLTVWLTYRLGQKLFSETVALLAAGLTVLSPFFLIQSGSMLSHPWGLVVTLVFVLAWLDTTRPRDDLPAWLPPLMAGLSLGVLALSRPYTALAVALPFGIHGLIMLWQGPRHLRRRILGVGMSTMLVASLHFLWQSAVTGDPFLNPYILWWPYDRVGFGPGHGVAPGGHNLERAWTGLQYSLQAGYRDLFGWGHYSWLFLPFGLWAMRKNGRAWLVFSVFLTLLIFYLAYWVGAWVYGPRYYYESLFCLTLVSAAGIAWLAGWPLRAGQPWPRYSDRRRWRALAVTALLALLVAFNLGVYLPRRLGDMHGQFGIQRADLAPFQTAEAQALTPALVVVHPEDWRDYAELLTLSSPFHDTPFIFIWSAGIKADQRVAADFPDRQMVHYYPERQTFYVAP